MNEKEILVKYHDSDLPKLQNIGGTSMSAMVDLYLANDVTLTPGNYYLLSLGISMKLPEGYHAIVIPRSSTFKKYGILQANSVGCIDNSYCGNNDVWMMPVFIPLTEEDIKSYFSSIFLAIIEENTDDFKSEYRVDKGLPKLDLGEYIDTNMKTRTVFIEKGTRICQFRIFKTDELKFIETSELSDNNRGGFGSTGK